MAQNEGALPEISVILATQDCYETIRKTVRHLRAQTACERLELVIIAPSREQLALVKEEVAGFCQVQVVEAGVVRSPGGAYAAGVRAAGAAVVAFTEDHAFPEPGWAEALIAAHRQPWAAVGPEMRNANPGSAISRAEFAIAFGLWMAPATAGVVDYLPGHNCSYKRALLLEYGEQLEVMMEAESVLQADLRARGHQLYLEPAARNPHLNFSRPSSWLRNRYHIGRLHAGSRVHNERWSAIRRLIHVGAAPLLPLVRLRGVVRELSRPGRPRHLLPSLLPVLLLGLASGGVGELVGYALGPGDAAQRLSSFEFHRVRLLARRDRFAQAD